MDGQHVSPGIDADQRGFGDADSLLEEFAAVIAHELATPLSIIEMAVQTALRNDGASSQIGHREVLEMVERNVKLAQLLVNRLTLSRDVEADTFVLDLASVDLAELVQEAVADLGPVVMTDNPVAVTVESSPTITADSTAVREIVFNLLSNACKYSEKGAAIEVTVRIAGAMAEVVVRNHGSGVAPGDTDAIFEKFHRGDTDAPGAGLGLFISRGLARAHGGDLTVQAAEHVGSEFCLTLPLDD
ncbi:MAG: HAMP domain-containing sensor histidine kinase [Nitriliruptoraceae bacterium]